MRTWTIQRVNILLFYVIIFALMSGLIKTPPGPMQIGVKKIILKSVKKELTVWALGGKARLGEFQFFVYPAWAGTESKSPSGLAPPKLREGDAWGQY